MSEPDVSRDAFYLAHILECIEAIETYCSLADPESDERTFDAVVRRLQILAESSKRLSEELKLAHPSVAWRELTGFRNVLVHDYLGIRVERITPIVTRDLPRLKTQITEILAFIGH